MDPVVLDAALERSPVNDDGRSGATLERVRLADGSQVVVKRYDPAADLVMRMVGDPRGLEVELWQSGFFDRLPPGIGHAILGGWFDDDGLGVLVMRDLGDSVLNWHDRVSPLQSRTMFAGLADLHAAFLGEVPAGLMPLGDMLGLFGPRRITAYAGNGLADHALRGWELWPEVAPGEVGDRVLALALDSKPLEAALARFPATVLHGDAATVNMAFEPGLTMIDWGLATKGPAEVDFGRLLAGCLHLFQEPAEVLLEVHRLAAGTTYDEAATRLGLLSGLVWLGWNKSLDIVEHPDPPVRERERTNLAWWLGQAELAFETGLI
jgi:hypothetical protein